ncbi:MAG: hypothetical protein CL534_19270 [Ahrensia sp.]|nr:hypothetical protein [Ahrensia sp.]
MANGGSNRNANAVGISSDIEAAGPKGSSGAKGQTSVEVAVDTVPAFGQAVWTGTFDLMQGGGDQGHRLLAYWARDSSA